jgi:polysaccharide chain length determinant protein (PEP-CTERM system associated)
MDLRDYLEVLRRRKWLIVFSFLLVLFGAVVYIVVVPPQYKSTTTILIIPQRVPEAFVQSTVSVGVEGRLATIQQQVGSRTVLTKVMDELGLFPMLRQRALPEDIIEGMRERIEIDVAQDRRRDRSAEAFSISFAYEDPKLAMLTASRLASLFIDENLRTREQQAVGTTEFLESQLQETKKKLEIQEDRIKRYKLQFMGELPQEIQSNLTTLTRLQDYFRGNIDRIRAAEDRKVFLAARFDTLEKSVSISPPPVPGSQPPQITEDPARLLLQKRAQVADLASKYTDRHPDLIRLRREVADLEKRIKETNREAASPDAGKNPSASDNTTPSAIYLSDREREEMQLLKAQITSTDAEISSLKNGSERIQKEIAAVQQKVDQAPRREQELISLTRDYDNLKNSYNELLKKRLEANISQNLEQRQKGEQFQVLDPANLPERPFKPDRNKVFLIAFVIASAIGFGGAVGLEMMDQTLREVKDFQHFFNVKVFATIPDVDNGAIARQQALRRGAIVGGFLLFLATVTLFLWIYEEKVRAILKI